MPLNETLKAVSDPVRRRILDLLKKNSMNAGEISAQFDITDAAISRHLSILKKAGLIRSYRNGQHIHYELNASVLDEILLWAENLKGETRENKQMETIADSH